MSETLNRAPSEAVYDDRQVQAYKALGEKVQGRKKQRRHWRTGSYPIRRPFATSLCAADLLFCKCFEFMDRKTACRSVVWRSRYHPACWTLKKVDGKDVDLHGHTAGKSAPC